MTKILKRRILLTIGYDGTSYCGWQLQSNGKSIQEAVENSIYQLTSLPTRIFGASRTDAGVHALGQRCHFDTESHIPIEKWQLALNSKLPNDIRIVKAQYVPDDFHARFDAVDKKYQYRIWNATYLHPILKNYCTHIPQHMNMKLMEEAVMSLNGTHDFAAFQASGGTAKNTIRTLHNCHLTKDGNMITLSVNGNAFLYNMVRIIAGTIIAIGQGRMNPATFFQSYESLNRLSLGITAPAQGLELSEIHYLKTY